MDAARWLVTALLLAVCTPVAAKDAYVLNGLGMYGARGPMGQIADSLTERGFKVKILPHTQGKRLTRMPDVLVGHSMGANAALKAANRLKRKPRIIVTIDPGRAPLFHKCPPQVRCVNLYNPWHPIGGQEVIGAENVIIPGIIHSFMPMHWIVKRRVIAEIEKEAIP